MTVYEMGLLRDLADLTAGVIRRMRAAYGSGDAWRRDVTRAVKVSEALSVQIANREGA